MKCLDKSWKGKVLLTDLSKAFDCLYQDFVIVKLNVYGFDKNVLKLFYSYYKERKQRVKIDNEYSE